MSEAKKHIATLDQVRGVAIIAVLLTHSLADAFGFENLEWNGVFRDFSRSDSFLWFLPISIGALGVPIFFIVSGFCIHLSFNQQGGRWGGFFIRRFFRIYPAYVAAIFFCLLLVLNYQRNGMPPDLYWKELMSHLLLVHNYSPVLVGGINASFWSLAVEAQLYLIYPALLWLVGRNGWRRTLFILAGIEIFIRGADGLTQTMGITDTAWGRVSWLLAASPFGYWCSWSLGAYLADCYLKNRPLPWQGISLAWIVGAAVGCYFLKPLDPMRFLLFAVATAIVLSRILQRQKTGGQAGGTIFSITLGRIGLWSYSIYLLHQPLINVFSTLLKFLVPPDYFSQPANFFFNCLLCIAIIPFSVAWYEVFEVTGIGLGRLFVQSRQDPAREPDKRTSLAEVFNRRRFFMTAAVLVMAVIGVLWGAAQLSFKEAIWNNNHAWSLATGFDPQKRDGNLAVKLAEDACQRTHFQMTICVGTLAAAYAEAGHFDKAVATAQEACGLAKTNGETDLLGKNLELLKLYQSNQPFHQSE
ncbi:MAG TPA: acyltransferase [Candidatus Sulfotelmatobacter sp.]|nr:acyltransferase [Candidatus Sulfotelmatobacter sp.]